MKPFTEPLESRRLFASYTASTVEQLIAAINSANGSGAADTITLAAGATFSLTTVHNATNGATGLPQIAGGGGLKILGSGATIERSAAAGTPPFRLFDVASNGSLTLTNVTLQGGLFLGPSYLLAEGQQGQAPGGAIMNRGALSLDGVTLQNNTAQGSAGSDDPYSYGPRTGGSASGGGVYSSGALTAVGCTLRNNSAVGGRGGNAGIGPTVDPGFINFQPGAAGGSASGGGIYVAAGNASVLNCTFTGNRAAGGDGGAAYGKRRNGGGGGAGFGGAFHTAAGAALRNCTITSNSASGGAAGGGALDGQGIGGGIYIGSGDSVGLDAFTVKHTAQNKASTSDRNIAGLYELLT
jgi:hypothetical protein